MNKLVIKYSILVYRFLKDYVYPKQTLEAMVREEGKPWATSAWFRYRFGVNFILKILRWMTQVIVI